MNVSFSVATMDRSNGKDGSYNNKNTEDIGDLTERMAKLWWEDKDLEALVYRQPNSQSPVNEVGSSWVGKSRYLASMSIQATMEKMWAKELYDLNSKEREDINNEIHGLKSSRAIQETPLVISEGVRSLRKLIIERVKCESGGNAVPVAIREVYERVVGCEGGTRANKVPYIHSQKFLVKFLRASFFDVDEACQRYFKCLDLMHGLFGEIALKRPLMMRDLTIREQRYLKKGQLQLLPSRDRAGRRIFSFFGREDRNFTVPEKYRVAMYLIDVCSEDESTQKLGILLVNSPRLNPGEKPFGEDGMALRAKKYERLGGRTEKEFHQWIHEAKPLRTAAIHYYGPDTFLYNVLGKCMALLLVGKEDRKRLRFHPGSQMECNYSLKSFGIPSDDLPQTDDRQMSSKKMARFIAARRSIEDLQQHRYEREETGEMNATTKLSHLRIGTECPEVNCIMFGNRSRKNAPNLEFRNILMIKEQQREEKIVHCEEVPTVKEFISDIIQTAKSPPHNLRFVAIDKTTSLFVEIEDPQDLYTAVSQALRDQRKRVRLEKRKLHSSAAKRSNEVSNDFESDKSGSIIGYDAAKRRKGSSCEGCWNP